MVENKAAVIEGIVSAGGENEKYQGMDLVAIDDAAYTPVRAMYATIGYPQFSEFIGE
jgi:phosphonate transport system substrate-binding protein